MWWGLSGDFAELLARASLKESPLVICSFGEGGPELLNCQEFDFWPQLFIPSSTVPSHKANPHLLKRLYHALLIFTTSQKHLTWLPPVFLMLASSNTSDIKLTDHPLPSFWFSV